MAKGLYRYSDRANGSEGQTHAEWLAWREAHGDDQLVRG